MGRSIQRQTKGLWAVLFAVVFLGHGLLLVGADENSEKNKRGWRWPW